ncbi:MAG: hypothetical protein Kapaf2KO_03200 [Candidatus Kapaibacteriales bacterium]
MISNRLSFLVLFLIFSISVVFGYTEKQKTGLYPTQTRTAIDLSEGWQYSSDGATWTKVNIPHSVRSQQPFYYEKAVKIPKSTISSYVWSLDFLGVTEEVEVYLNGSFIEKFFAGGGSYSLTIPQDMVSESVNTFRFKVYPPTGSTAQALGRNIFSPEIRSGLIGNIFLIGKPKIFIDGFKHSVSFGTGYSSAKLDFDISISSKLGDYLSIGSQDFEPATEPELQQSTADSTFIQDTTTTVNNPNFERTVSSKTYSLQAIIYDNEGRVSAQAERMEFAINPDRTITRKMILSLNNPTLWSPQNPILYRLEISVLSSSGSVIDTYTEFLGVRDLKIEEKSLSLNGLPFTIKGVNYTTPIGLDSISLPASLEADINRIKTLGANTVLTNKIIPHPYLVHLCDKYGLFILSDLPVDNVPSQLTVEDDFIVRTKNISKRLIDSYENRVSLLGWGVYGGDVSSGFSSGFIGQIVSQIRSISSKPIYSTLDLGNSNSGISDSELDFLVLRIPSSARNFDQIETMLNYTVEKINIPIIARYGIAVQTKNLNGYFDKQSEDYQAYYLLNMEALVRETGGSGNIIDFYRDFRLENPLLIVNKNDFFLGTGGLVDSDGREKTAFKVVKSLFNSEKLPLLSPGEGGTSSTVIFVIVSIAMIIIVLLLLNRYRRFRENFQRSLIRPYNFYSDIRDQRIMSTTRTFLIGFVIAVSIGMYVTGIVYHFRATEALQNVLMLLVPSNTSLEFIFGLAWQPVMMLLFFSTVFFVLVFVVAVILVFFGLFSKNNITIGDTVTIAIWSAIPFLLMLPVNMVMSKLFDFGGLAVAGVIILGLFLALWIFMRIIRSTSVVFDKALPTVFLIGLSLVVAVLIVQVIYYQSNTRFVDYLSHYISTI